MSTVRVGGDDLVYCLEEQKKVYLQGVAKTHAEYEESIRGQLRKKWWQWWKPKTFEEALSDLSSVSLVWDACGYQESTPEGGEKSWRRHWGNLKRMADHASATGGFVELSEDQACILRFLTSRVEVTNV